MRAIVHKNIETAGFLYARFFNTVPVTDLPANMQTSSEISWAGHKNIETAGFLYAQFFNMVPVTDLTADMQTSSEISWAGRKNIETAGFLYAQFFNMVPVTDLTADMQTSSEMSWAGIQKSYGIYSSWTTQNVENQKKLVCVFLWEPSIHSPATKNAFKNFVC